MLCRLNRWLRALRTHQRVVSGPGILYILVPFVIATLAGQAFAQADSSQVKPAQHQIIYLDIAAPPELERSDNVRVFAAQAFAKHDFEVAECQMLSERRREFIRSLTEEEIEQTTDTDLMSIPIIASLLYNADCIDDADRAGDFYIAQIGLHQDDSLGGMRSAAVTLVRLRVISADDDADSQGSSTDEDLPADAIAPADRPSEKQAFLEGMVMGGLKVMNPRLYREIDHHAEFGFRTKLVGASATAGVGWLKHLAEPQREDPVEYSFTAALSFHVWR